MRNDRTVKKLNDLLDVAMKTGDAYSIVFQLVYSVVYVYEVNGYDYKKLFKALK